MNLGLHSMMLYVAPRVYICFHLQSHHHTLFPPTLISAFKNIPNVLLFQGFPSRMVCLEGFSPRCFRSWLLPLKVSNILFPGKPSQEVACFSIIHHHSKYPLCLSTAETAGLGIDVSAHCHSLRSRHSQALDCLVTSLPWNSEKVHGSQQSNIC